MGTSRTGYLCVFDPAMEEQRGDSSELVIYIKDGCPYCEEALEYLKGAGVSFGVVNVTGDDEALDELDEVSQLPADLFQHHHRDVLPPLL